MNRDNFPDKYKEALDELKNEKMNWEFEDFLRDAAENEAPKIRKPTLKPMFWAAAAIALLLGLSIVFYVNKTPSISEKEMMVKKEIIRQKSKDSLQIYAQSWAKKQDSVAASEKDSIFDQISSDKEAQKILDKILPKQGRLRKNSRERYVINSTKKLAPDTANISGRTTYHDDFVTINGHKIENEKEAIDVTKYSLQMLSEKVSKTVAKTEPVTEFVDF